MEKIIKTIASYIIDDSESINISINEDSYSFKINLKVPEKDIGKIIGKNGRIAKAIRLIANAYPKRNGKKIYIDISSNNNV